MGTGRRVVVTGLSAVGPPGIGKGPVWDGLLSGRSYVGPIQAFDATGFDCAIGSEIKDFSCRDFVPKSYRKAVKVMARDIQLAVAAADTAVRDAGLKTKGVDCDGHEVDSARLGCNIGAGLISCDLVEMAGAVQHAMDEEGRFSIEKWGEDGMTRLTPLWLLKYLPNMLACHVTIVHDAQGPSNTITCAEVSSHLAVGEAFGTIARGAATVCLCGGAESKVNPMSLMRQTLFERLTTQSNDKPSTAVRPFDAGASGTVVSEGGGVLILEDLEHAQQRNATIYAEIAGFGAAISGRDDLKADPQGRATTLAIESAMRRAEMTPEQLDLIIPDGFGLREWDLAESRGIAAALGPRSSDIPAMPLKGRYGNLGAGAGSLDSFAAVMAIHHQTILPAVNFEKAVEGCTLSIVHGEPVEREVRAVLSVIGGIGGQQAALVFKRFEG